MQQSSLWSSRPSYANTPTCHECQCAIDLLRTKTRHITPLLQQLYSLPFRLRIEFKILLITSIKVPHQGSAPKYLIDLISVLPPSRYDLRRKDKGILLSTPKRFTKVLAWGIDPSWRNHLHVSIRSTCITSDFKQRLNTFLFSKAFCLYN